jgi:hypothetical protein
MITWGQLAKSQTDPEKIEEAIARLIAEHDANPEAHLGEGGSLQSHKMSEIIDHLVESIVADKIKDGEVTKPKLDINAVPFVDSDFDRGAIVDFTNFEGTVSGSGTIERDLRINKVVSGYTQGSVAKVYNLLRQSGEYWICATNLRFDFHIYAGEDWGWEEQPGGEVYIKYGEGNNADMGGNSDRCFGFKITDQSSGYLKIIGFARCYSNLQTVELANDIDMTLRYVLSVVKIYSTFNFYINGVLKGSVVCDMQGTAVYSYLTHAAKSPYPNSGGCNTITQIGFLFPF